ncbi:MAG: hypothetical protein ACAH83_04560 [Alphaproteobacteria bacterium]
MLRIILASSTVALIAIAAIVYVFSKSKVVDEMIDAAHRADVAAFSSRIDWAGAREYAKADLAKQKGGIGGDQMGPAKTEIPPVVDYYMQPANLDILFYLREELFPNIPEKDFIQSISYSPPYGFTVTVGLPKTVGGGEIPEALRGRIKTWATFRLDGLTWKLREFTVPLFMVPPHVYDTPAFEIYGRPKH